MPFLYKPKFCCQCGEAIERVEWKLWTSRRFCNVCESVQKQHDLVPRAFLAVGLFAGLFGISGFMARPKAEPTNPMQLSSARPARPVNKVQEITQSAPAGPRNDRSIEAPSTAIAAATAKSDLDNSPKTKLKGEGSEAVYFCGAATKKGTPCSRRVKSPGRCWQHMGQPSMIADTRLPQAK